MAAALLALAGPALAVNPDEQLADPALEARARALSQELRCVVCQNQSIDNSDAPLARDLRIIVRERLLAGETDDQAKDLSGRALRQFRAAEPAVRTCDPGAVAGAAVRAVGRRRRGRGLSRAPVAQGRREAAALTADEQARVDALLRDNNG